LEVSYGSADSFDGLIWQSYLCAASDSSFPWTCQACHLSCNCDVNGLCQTCKDATLTPDPLLNACRCTGNSGSANGIYSASCDTCHSDCATCNLSGNSNSCLTCSASNYSPGSPFGGSCACKLTNIIPGSSCVACPNNCPYCVDSDPDSCLSQAEVDFSLTAASLYGLPMLTEQDSFVCYRTSAFNHDNARCAMEKMMGNLGTGAITVTKGQCYQLIQSQWPVVDSWFADIFSTFSLPNFASNTSRRLFNCGSCNSVPRR